MGSSWRYCSTVTGDELLTWTIETFNTFYSKTWFARRILPIFYTIPLLISYFSFIYDNYSDIELSYSYYKQGYGLNETIQEKVILTRNMTDMIPSPKYENFCPLYVMKTSSAQDCEYPPRRAKVRTRLMLTMTLNPLLYDSTRLSPIFPCCIKADIITSSLFATCLIYWYLAFQEDYIVAFIFNIVCILIPLVVFAMMFAIDTRPFLDEMAFFCWKKSKM